MLSYSLFAMVLRSVRVVTVGCGVQFPLSFHVEAKSASVDSTWKPRVLRRFHVEVFFLVTRKCQQHRSTGCLFLSVRASFITFMKCIQSVFFFKCTIVGVRWPLRSTLVLIAYNIRNLSPSREKNTQKYTYSEDIFIIIYTRCSFLKTCR